MGIPTRRYPRLARYRLPMHVELAREATTCTVLSEAAAEQFRRYLLRDPEVVPRVSPAPTSPSRTGARRAADDRLRGQPGGAAQAAAASAGRVRRASAAPSRRAVFSSPGRREPGFQIALPDGAERVEATARTTSPGRSPPRTSRCCPRPGRRSGSCSRGGARGGDAGRRARMPGRSPEIVTPEVGRLFEPDDRDSLGERPGRGARAERQPREACRAHARQWDWAAIGPRYETLLERAAEDRDSNVESQIASNPLWYHTLELGPDVVTPGWFDLRPIVDRLPWPDVAGKRCLDVGHLRRLPRVRARAPRRGRGGGDRHRGPLALGLAGAHARATGRSGSRRWPGSARGIGFDIAKEALGSSVTTRRAERLRPRPGRGRAASTSSSAAASCSTCATRCARSRRSAACAAGSFLSAEQVDDAADAARAQGGRPPLPRRRAASSGGCRTSPATGAWSRPPDSASSPGRTAIESRSAAAIPRGGPRRGLAHSALLAQPEV